MTKPDFLAKYRLKHGMCIGCGNQTHLVKGTGPFRKFKPLNTNHASNGTCLRCNPPKMDIRTPIATEALPSLPASIVPVPLQEYSANLIGVFSNDDNSQSTLGDGSAAFSQRTSREGSPPPRNPDLSFPCKIDECFSVGSSPTELAGNIVRNDNNILSTPTADCIYLDQNEITRIELDLKCLELEFKRNKSKNKSSNSLNEQSSTTTLLQRELEELGESYFETQWRNAQKFHQIGINNGVLGGKLETAKSALDKADKYMQDLMSSGHCESRIKYIGFQIQLLIDSANLYNLMCQWDDARNKLSMAIKLHEETWNHKELGRSRTIAATLLLVDIYRPLYVTEHSVGNKRTYVSLNQRAIALLRGVQRRDDTNEKMKFLLATFLAYNTMHEKSLEKRISLGLEASAIIKKLTVRYPNNKMIGLERAQICRLCSFIFRDQKKIDGASKAIHCAVKISNTLVESNPEAPLFLSEMYRDYGALVSHLKAVNKLGQQNDVILSALMQEEAFTAKFLDIVPSSVKCYDHLTLVRVDIAKMQREKGDVNAAMNTLALALESAEYSVQSTDSASVKTYYNLACVLAESGTILFDEKQYETSIPFFVRAEEVYSSSIFVDINATKYLNYLEQFGRVMKKAYSCAVQGGYEQYSHFFGNKVIEVGRDIKNKMGETNKTGNRKQIRKLLLVR